MFLKVTLQGNENGEMGKWANRKVEICHPQCVKLRLLVLPLLTFTSRQAKNKQPIN